jgi:hypothetical protein
MQSPGYVVKFRYTEVTFDALNRQMQITPKYSSLLLLLLLLLLQALAVLVSCMAWQVETQGDSKLGAFQRFLVDKHTKTAAYS